MFIADGSQQEIEPSSHRRRPADNGSLCTQSVVTGVRAVRAGTGAVYCVNFARVRSADAVSGQPRLNRSRTGEQHQMVVTRRCERATSRDAPGEARGRLTGHS